MTAAVRARRQVQEVGEAGGSAGVEEEVWKRGVGGTGRRDAEMGEKLEGEQ